MKPFYLENYPSVTAETFYHSNENNKMEYLSAFSTKTNCTNIVRHINAGGLSCNCNYSYMTTCKDDYRCHMTPVAGTDYYHLIITRRDKAEENEDDNHNPYLHCNVYVQASANDETYKNIEDGHYPQEVLDGLFAKLNGTDKFRGLSSIALLPEWMDYIAHQLWLSDHFTAADGFATPDTEGKIVYCYHMECDDVVLRDIVSLGLRNGNISIHNATEVSDTLQNLHGLDDYLSEFGPTLAEHLQETTRPRFVPGEDSYSHALDVWKGYVESNALIRPYPAQLDVIQGAANALNDEKFALICAVMGSGKTLMGIGTAFATNHFHHKMLNAVYCPNHLSYKWQEEIARFAPQSESYIVSDVSDLMDLMPRIKNKNRSHNLWLIFPKDKVKSNYSERPAAVWNAAKKCYCCPVCGKPLYKEVNDPQPYDKKHKKKEFFGPTAFRNANGVNMYCPNHKNKKVFKDGKWKTVGNGLCHTKLWTSNARRLEDGDIDMESRDNDWIKLTGYGWLERRFIDTEFDRLDKLQKRFDALSDKKKKEQKTPFDQPGDKALYSALRKIVNSGDEPHSAPAVRKYDIGTFINRHLKHAFDFLIADEIHEYKAQDSMQGACFARLAAAANRIIGLTGTLMNGYADALYYILYRLCPERLRDEGFQYEGRDAKMSFAKHYGRVENITRYAVNRDGTDSGKGFPTKKIIAGASPLLFTRFLMENTVFMDLSDIAEGLPDYSETPIGVDMDTDLQLAYEDFRNNARSNSLHDMAVAGRTMPQIFMTLQAYPDMPHDFAPVVDKANGNVIAEPADLPTLTRSKEQQFTDLVQERIANGEKVLVYYHWSNVTDVGERLPQLLENLGIQCSILKPSSEGGPKPEDRSTWIEEQLADGCQVLFTNPKLVATGLDLLAFTSIIWYQVSNNLFTMMQANRRSLRLNQVNDVHVYYLYYKGTQQETNLIQMADKQKAAYALQGHFSEEGLSAIASASTGIEASASMLSRSLAARHLDADAFAANTIHNEERIKSARKQLAVVREKLTLMPTSKRKKTVDLFSDLLSA